MSNFSAQEAYYKEFVLKEDNAEQVETEKNLEVRTAFIKSYNRSFGIMFLVFFILLFFPGIGISGKDSCEENEIEGEQKEESL